MIVSVLKEKKTCVKRKWRKIKGFLAYIQTLFIISVYNQEKKYIDESILLYLSLNFNYLQTLCKSCEENYIYNAKSQEVA